MISPEDCKMTKLFTELKELNDFLSNHTSIINSHMNDFFTNNLDKLEIPGNSEECYFRECAKMAEIGCCYTAKACHSEYCLDDLSDPDSNCKNNRYMTDKKYHELHRFAPSVKNLSDAVDCNKIVDFGSGKGYLGHFLSENLNLHVVGLEANRGYATSAHDRKQQVEKYNKCKPSKEKYLFDSIQYELCFETDEDEQLVELLSEKFCSVQKEKDKHDESIVLIGLHACGDLTSMAIKLFASKHIFKCLHIIGCCYNLISDEKGFPISKYLIRNHVTLSKQARMLACQCCVKWKTSEQELKKSLLFRAILERMLMDAGVDRSVLSQVQFRRIGKKCSSLDTYVENIQPELQLHGIHISQPDVEKYSIFYEAKWDAMKKFHWIRMQLAPCIEKLILLDRLCYLFELGFMNAAIVQVFSPTRSPRCYSIVCVK